jgi:hypothetical protein
LLKDRVASERARADRASRVCHRLLAALAAARGEPPQAAWCDSFCHYGSQAVESIVDSYVGPAM